MAFDVASCVKAFTRLTPAAMAAVGAGVMTTPGDLEGAVAAGLLTVASGYLAGRGAQLEGESERRIRESKNHHLQLVIVAAVRLALQEMAPQRPLHEDTFARWDALWGKLLDGDLELMAAVVPADFQTLTDAANPYLQMEEGASAMVDFLAYALAYQLHFETNGSYPAVPPTLESLPQDLTAVLRTEFWLVYQRNFANLLSQEQGIYAHRAFERRHLQELLAGQRQQMEILRRLDRNSEIPLRRLKPRPALDPTRELDILRAESRAVPFVGREGDLRALHAWLGSKAKVSFRVLVGTAGAGKTRLGYQLMEELASVFGGEWDAGFLREGDLPHLLQRQWSRPTLAIVDYAGPNVVALKKWLSHLAEGQWDFPIRVLLMEREATGGASWFGYLTDESTEGRAIRDALEPREPLRVSRLDTQEMRRQVLRQAAELFGEAVEIPGPGQSVEFDRALAGARWEDPLYLVMAVLVAKQAGGLLAALSLSRPDLAFRVAEREMARIRRFCPGQEAPQTADLLVHLAALVTACGAVSQLDLGAIAKAEATEIGIHFSNGPGVAADLVGQALYRDGEVRKVEPDIVGEALMIRALGHAEKSGRARALVRVALAYPESYRAALCAAVMRACQNFGYHGYAEPLSWVEFLLRSAMEADLGFLFAVQGAIPHQNTVLRDVAVRIDRALLERLRKLEQRGQDEFVGNLSVAVVLACVLNIYATRLSEVGKPTEALEAARESLEIWRELAQRSQDTFLPYLAGGLNTYAQMLHAVGMREEALETAREALKIWRDVVQWIRERFLPDFALSLSSNATVMGAVGKREEAVAAEREAVEIRRQLAQENRDAYLPDLAMSLSNYANCLRQIGKREDALEAASESLDLYRELTRGNPDAFLPELARTLNTRAVMLRLVGDLEEALGMAGEAVEICRELAEGNRNAFLPDLALALNTYAGMRREIRNAEDALGAMGEAVKIWRELAQGKPAAFLLDLAASLNNYGVMLGEVGKQAEALEALEEGVAVNRRLAAENPDALLPNLATSLNNYANWLSEVGKRAEAVKAAGEAVVIGRKLAAENSDAFLPELAQSLAVLAKVSLPDQLSAAKADLEEALRALLPFVRAMPEAHAPLFFWIAQLYVHSGVEHQYALDEALVVESAALLQSLGFLPDDTDESAN